MYDMYKYVDIVRIDVATLIKHIRKASKLKHFSEFAGSGTRFIRRTDVVGKSNLEDYAKSSKTAKMRKSCRFVSRRKFRRTCG